MSKRLQFWRMKRRSSGTMVDSLVTREAALAALKALFEPSMRYTVTLTRSPVDPVTRIQRPREILVTEASTDPLRTDTVDPRIAKANRAVCLITYPDDGALYINWGQRRWELLVDSSQARSALVAANRALYDGRRLPLLSFGASLWLVFWPITWGLTAFTLAIFMVGVSAALGWSDARVEEISVAIGTILEKLWIWPWAIAGPLGLFIIALYVKAGALRVWPEALSVVSLYQAFYSIRAAFSGWVLGIIAGALIIIFGQVALEYLGLADGNN